MTQPLPPYDPTAGRFTLQNALCCALASEMAYECPNVVCGDAAAYVGRAGGAIIVAFRGTRNLRDLLADADCDMVQMDRHGKAMVHHGFHRYVSAIREAIGNEIAAQQTVFMRMLPVIFTGHSLGGAMATLYAAMGSTAREVYTFGQPRVGDGAFARCLSHLHHKTHYRIVDQEDVVARVPGWLMGYRDAKTQLHFISWEGKIWHNPNFWRRLRSDLIGIAHDLLAGREALLSDHHIGLYVEMLRKAGAK